MHIITNEGRLHNAIKKSMEKKTTQPQQQIQLKLSTIFKQKVIDTPQTFGSFYDANGEKYCAISVLSKYLGYDIAAAIQNKIQNGKNTNPAAELIPYAIALWQTGQMGTPT